MVAAARRLARMRPPTGGLVMAAVWALAAGIAGAGLLEQRVVVVPAITAGGASDSLGPPHRWPAGSKFSDAVQVPGTSTVLLVDDDVYDQVFAWDAAAEALPPRPLPLPTDIRVDDAEGIAADGQFVYVAGSHSLSRDGVSRRDRLVRLRWTPAGLSADSSVDGLTALLSAALPEIAAGHARASNDAGLNIEGLAWDARRQRLLLGLRSPLAADGSPLVVPLHWPADAAAPIVEAPIRIGGMTGGGLRALRADPLRGGFLLTTERSEGAGAGFVLWRWTGNDGAAATPITHFPAELDGVSVKVEGVASVRVPGREAFVLAVTDDAPYAWTIRN